MQAKLLSDDYEKMNNTLLLMLDVCIFCLKNMVFLHPHPSIMNLQANKHFQMAKGVSLEVFNHCWLKLPFS